MADLSGVVLSLALVVGFIFAAAWVVRRMPSRARPRQRPAQGTGGFAARPRERLVLVEARGEELLIAVSPAGVFNVGAPHVRSPLPSRLPSPPAKGGMINGTHRLFRHYFPRRRRLPGLAGEDLIAGIVIVGFLTRDCPAVAGLDAAATRRRCRSFTSYIRLLPSAFSARTSLGGMSSL